MTFLIDLIAATFRNATPLVYGTVGETVTERAGVLNLGIEGTMYAGAFAGFAVAFATGDPLIGLLAAILVGLAAGAAMGFMTVTLGANQHVSGLGLTIVLIGLAIGNRLLLTGSEVQRITPMERWDPLAFLGPVGEVAHQYGLTYVAFLVVAPLAWWLLARTPLGLSIRGRENPEAADAAGLTCTRPLHGDHAGLGPHGGRRRLPDARRARQLHARHHRGAWLGVHRARHLRAVAHLAGRRRPSSSRRSTRWGCASRSSRASSGCRRDQMLALPYLAVIAALALSGRNVPYPGAYLKPYRRP